MLAICITSTNTLSQLLSFEGTSIPAFQTFFNYVLLNIVYTSYTIYKYGFKKWGRLLLKDGWRFFILAFFDVEGNYFVVLAYRYVRTSTFPLRPLSTNPPPHRPPSCPHNSSISGPSSSL